MNLILKFKILIPSNFQVNISGNFTEQLVFVTPLTSSIPQRQLFRNKTQVEIHRVAYHTLNYSKNTATYL